MAHFCKRRVTTTEKCGTGLAKLSIKDKDPQSGTEGALVVDHCMDIGYRGLAQ